MGVMVQYVGERDLWHARVLLRPCSKAVFTKVMSVVPDGPAGSCWWVATPDGDIYPESYTVSADVEAFTLFDWEREAVVPRTMTPPGKRLGPVYEFAPGRGPGDLTLVTFARAATAAEKFDREAIASLEKPRRPGAKAVPKAGARETSGSLPDLEGFNVWRCVAPRTSQWFNKAVTADKASFTRHGDFLFTTLEGEPMVLAAEADDVEIGKSNDEVLDARVLSITTNDGRRVRSFRETIPELTETSWSDQGWPVAGPRTFRWLVRFIGENSVHPLAHHVRFKQLAGLTSSDPGAAEHERCMRVIETALVFDQVQGAELAALELVARAAQLIELRHREKIIGGFGNSVDEDAFLYLGSGKTRGLLAVSPLLEEYVASELSKETATLKERRKAREERSAPHPKKEAKGGGKAQA